MDFKKMAESAQNVIQSEQKNMGNEEVCSGIAAFYV